MRLLLPHSLLCDTMRSYHELPNEVQEPVEADIIECCLNLVHHIERRRARPEDSEEERRRSMNAHRPQRQFFTLSAGLASTSMPVFSKSSAPSTSVHRYHWGREPQQLSKVELCQRTPTQTQSFNVDCWNHRRVHGAPSERLLVAPQGIRAAG